MERPANSELIDVWAEILLIITKKLGLKARQLSCIELWCEILSNVLSASDGVDMRLV